MARSVTEQPKLRFPLWCDDVNIVVCLSDPLTRCAHDERTSEPGPQRQDPAAEAVLARIHRQKLHVAALAAQPLKHTRRQPSRPYQKPHDQGAPDIRQAQPRLSGEPPTLHVVRDGQDAKRAVGVGGLARGRCTVGGHWGVR
eukprot:3687718-Prymnesium_polylepis.1